MSISRPVAELALQRFSPFAVHHLPLEDAERRDNYLSEPSRLSAKLRRHSRAITEWILFVDSGLRFSFRSVGRLLESRRFAREIEGLGVILSSYDGVGLLLATRWSFNECESCLHV